MNTPQTWPHIVAQLVNYMPGFHQKIVRWSLTPTGWSKCNTDGACRGNPGESSAAFYIRDADGNLVYDEAKRLGITNSIKAEAIAIQGGIQHYIE